MVENSKLNSLNEIEKKLLFAFVAYTKEFDLEYVTEEQMLNFGRQLRISAALRSNTIDKLCRREVFSKQMDHRNIIPIIKIHPSFHDEAIPLYHDDQEQLENSVPASDRFVSINHNSQDVQQAIAKLEEIKDRVKNSNELKANQEQRLAIIREVSDIRMLLDGPIVRAVSLWNATKNSGILSCLTQHGSDAVLNALAVEAVGHILKLIGCG